MNAKENEIEASECWRLGNENDSVNVKENENET